MRVIFRRLFHGFHNDTRRLEMGKKPSRWLPKVENEEWTTINTIADLESLTNQYAQKPSE